MNILIVDDDPTILKLLGALLRTKGHSALGASDGVEALEILGREKCDAIISDILMPRMDGYQLCRDVRRDERFRSLPFIFYSATYTSQADEKFSFDLGANKFLRKPASAGEIVAALAEAVDSDQAASPSPTPALPELEIMKEYSGRLVAKLEEKNIELAAALSQLELQSTALQIAANAVLVTDALGKIRWVNPAFTELTGYAPEEAIGQTPRILKSGAHDKAFYKAFWETILAGDTWRGEFINRRKDGSLTCDEHTVTPVRDREGRITHFVGILRDITARKQNEKKLQEQTEALARSNAELLQFNRLAVGRELRAIELKTEVNQLLARLGEPPRYDLHFTTPEVAKTEPVQAAKADGSRGFQNRRILVIDDTPSIREDFRKILTPQRPQGNGQCTLFAAEEPTPFEFHLECAASGEEGLERVRRAASESQPFGLVFLDVRMVPGWDGVETARRLWKEDPDLQIVLCTAYSDYTWTDLQALLKTHGQPLILKKPFDVIEVKQFALALLEKWSLGQESKRKLIDLEAAVIDRTRDIEASRIAALNMMADTVEACSTLERTNRTLEQHILDGERTASALREAEEKYRSIFESATVGIIRASPDWALLDVNPTMARILGCESPEALKRELSEVGGLRQLNPARRLEFQKTLEEKGVVRDFEFEVTHKGGRKTWISGNARAVENDQGKVARYEGSFLDITERKRLEEQLRQAQKMEAIGQLAGGVAHDFNNLLMVINGYSSILLDSAQLSGPGTENLKEIYLAGERAATLTRQLLTFSRKQTVQLQVLELNGVVNGVAKMLRRVIGEDIQLHVESAGVETSILADVGMIEQVLMNLVVNARDAMPKGGLLTIRLAIAQISESELTRHPKARPGKFASLAVKDTGCGMSQEVLTHLFEPFFTTKPVGKGTGMGLATVFGIVEQHHGWIEIETVIDVGTTFTVVLPLAETIDVKPNAVGSAKPASGGNEVILVVEDEEGVRSLAVLILKKLGYRVLEAASGPEALEVWERHGTRIDLLLTDIVMPGDMTGLDLTEKLREKKSSLKVIYASGYSPDLMSLSFGVASNIPFLQKPYTPTQLASTVRACLDARQ